MHKGWPKGPVVSVALLAALAALPAPAGAVCTVDQTTMTATCSGDLSAGNIEQNDLTTVTVSNLTADIAPPGLDNGVTLLNGKVGEAQANMPGIKGPSGSLDFNDSSFGVSANGGIGLFVAVIGQGGGVGSGSNNGTGNPGQTGGDAGNAVLTVNASSLAAIEFNGGGLMRGGTAVAAQSLAGNGGDGVAQPGSTSTTNTLTGGNGGQGGNAGTASAAVTTPSLTVTGQGSGVLVTSSGGDGGPISESQVVSFGSAFGGMGGNGGNGGAASADLSIGSLSVVKGNGAGVLVQSIGGNGGLGMNAGNANINPTGYIDSGGDGGFGGNGGSASVTGSVAVTAAASGAFDAVRVESTGGTGGAGGTASNSFSAQGGDGGIGGAGGAVQIGTSASAPFDATIAVTGGNARGIFARSLGAAGGAGGVVDGGGTEVVGRNGAALGSGPGGDLTLFIEGSVSTQGDSSDALIAQSIGGFVGGGSTDDGYSAGIGSAGAGGGAALTLTTKAPAGSSTAFSTDGLASDAVAVQSVGGGGGKAFQVLQGLTALGATGFAGGKGGDLQATVAGAGVIETKGDFSRGVYLHSLGAGGGNAGPNMTVTALGASGGTAGDGGQVTASVSAPIVTEGRASDGILAASRGGGGGSALSTSGVESVGGKAGSGGGSGGPVSLTVGGSVTTAGEDANAIQVQSLGGGGGDGASVSSGGVLFDQAIGGSGGDGGSAGPASLSQPASASTQAIQTGGDRARGAFVQSVGGGGGSGGNAVTFAAGPVNYSHAVGGSGGSGGAGGTASLALTAPITTKGNLADGAFVQSVGGGGGSGGSATSIGEGTLTFTHAVGGSGGGGGPGDTVTASASGAIATAGEHAAGLVAQSIGGGGGSSGAVISVDGGNLATYNQTVGGSGGSGQDAGTVTVNASGAIATTGSGAKGLVAHSVGGGGGNASSSVGAATAMNVAAVNVAIGGSGGSAGDGEAVKVTAGAISTEGVHATGLSALSIGGGGGIASTVFNVDAVTIGTIDVAVGRKGGTGGNAGAVTVTAEGAISTKGNLADGIHAASIGGFGGDSGAGLTAATNANLATAGSIDVTIGGDGGKGGNASDVSLSTQGDISTAGHAADGILVQSLAGGGGRAYGSVTANAIDVGNVAVTVGGDGGKGGTAGNVTLDTAAASTISTGGPLSPGVLAQSLGGAGGSGGFAAEFSANIGVGSGVSGQVGITLGGGGGSGGSAGQLAITSAAAIETGDFGSVGLHAQSIGGSGGVGGSVYAGNLDIGNKASINVDMAVGGNGGGGSSAGDITLSNAGAITTDGFLAPAILAQSIGGDGGNAGSTYTVGTQIGAATQESLQISIGGGGGNGAVAQDVFLENSGKIVTMKGGSDGLVGQSIGGGGGRGGNAAYLGIDLTPPVKSDATGLSVGFDANLGDGGDGGNGADAGLVSINNMAPITTGAARSRGIFAQSIGGGGGEGGTASATSYAVSDICHLGSGQYVCPTKEGNKTIQINATLQIGGSGGGAGSGGSVVVGNTASIETAGNVSHAIYAQSIGGGGGNGGDGSLGLSAWTTNSIARNIGDLPSNVLPSFTSADIVIGGSGGSAGDGGDVLVQNQGALMVKGPPASVVDAYKGLEGAPPDPLPLLHSGMGIFAQSVGGGGGDGGAGHSSLTAIVTVGNSGSGGGEGGKVTVTNSGAITTLGFSGAGILAQSVGGGGGTAGNVGLGWSNSWTDLNIGAGLGIQLNAGDGGDGGAVSVASTGAIVTKGVSAPGIIAQSVGGSGGMAGVVNADSTNGIMVGSRGADGNGGAVSVKVGAPVTVSGEGSVGVAAHSAGGIATSDSSGAVTIDIAADVAATGKGGRGLLVGSASYQNQANGTVSITVAEGAEVSTAAEGAETLGVLSAGNGSKIVNQGTIVSGNPTSYAIRAEATGGLTITNEGTITGSILGETGTAGGDAGLFTFTNSGQLNSGSEISLAGSAAPQGFTNASGGTLSPAGLGTIGSTAITAPAVDLAGSYQLDLDPSIQSMGVTSSDSLALTPKSQTIGGTVAPNVIVSSPGQVASQGSADILSSPLAFGTGGITVDNTAATTYSLSTKAEGGQTVLVLNYAVNTTPWLGTAEEQAKVPGSLRSRINRNHKAFGDYVTTLLTASAETESQAFLEELGGYILNIPAVSSLIDTYDGFAPGELVAPADAALFSGLRFADSLNSCPALGDTDKMVFNREGTCGWMEVAGSANRRQSDGDAAGYDETAFSVSGGLQVEVAEGLFAGLGLGYERANLSADDLSGDGNRFLAGAVVKKELGATTLSLSLSGGVSDYDLTRSLVTPSGGASASSSPNTNWISGHARASHEIPFAEGLFLTPRFDLGVTQQWQGGYTESGAGAYGLDVESYSETFVSLNPVLAFGGDFEVLGAVSRASARAGLLAILPKDRSLDMRLIGLNGGGPSFTVTNDVKPVFADLGLAVDTQVLGNVSLKLGVDTLLAGQQQIYSGGARLRINF